MGAWILWAAIGTTWHVASCVGCPGVPIFEANEGFYSKKECHQALSHYVEEWRIKEKQNKVALLHNTKPDKNIAQCWPLGYNPNKEEKP